MKRLRVLTLLLILLGCVAAPPDSPRVVILGFDGLDFGLTRELMAKGRMPNFSRLAATGGFTSLATSIPPQSPVAWSSFMTGLDPGGHGIFDFVHRDPRTMVPYLSTTRTEGGSKQITLGRWRLPLTSGRVLLLRRGHPFWETTESHGIMSTVIRMPANYPPSGTATRELAGMGTPDILGTYGVFSLYTADQSALAGAIGGGVVYRVDATRGVVHGTLEGPPQPYLTEPEPMRASFTAYVDDARQFVKIAIGDEERVLGVGEWSDWVPITFELKPRQTLRGQCRFYLKQLTPYFELYASPVNVDPTAPAVQISTPDRYASELAKATGRFYTQGMPEDSKALKAGVLSIREFLEQARIAQSENRRQFRYVLSHFGRGLLFYYFGNVDQVSHVLWGARDAEHPTTDRSASAYAHVIDDLYVEMDDIVGETLERLGSRDLLVVMSDHGFASWRRSFNLNTWLRDHGYLAAASRDGATVLNQIDLSRTRAYGLGLNGLYINVKGREALGTVDSTQRAALVDEIRTKLLHTTDPGTGDPVVARAYRPDQAFASTEHGDIAPDLILGYTKGTRVSDESAIGELSATAFGDNRTAWTGDHCMDPEAVPGILLTNRPLKKPAASLQSLATSILAELGIDRFPPR